MIYNDLEPLSTFHMTVFFLASVVSTVLLDSSDSSVNVQVRNSWSSGATRGCRGDGDATAGAGGGDIQFLAVQVRN